MESSDPERSQSAADGASRDPGAPASPHGDPDAPVPHGVHQPPAPDVHGSRPQDARSAPHRLARHARRAGGGGRWWLWLGRAVLWAFILVVVFNGIRAPLARVLEPAETSTSPAGTRTSYPTSEASAYALQFANAYLTYTEDDSQQRSRMLAEYLPPGADPQLGWNGEGSLQLESVQVADVAVRSSRHGTVTLSVQAGGEWMRLAVPVYADGDAMVISGQPALLPAPPRAQLPAPEDSAVDEAVAGELRSQLPGFFRAYAGSDTESLARYLAPGVSMTGFAGAVTFQSLDDVTVPAGKGTTRSATAAVTWALPEGGGAGGELQQTYRLTVTKQDGRWYVRDIRGAPSAGFS